MRRGLALAALVGIAARLGCRSPAPTPIDAAVTAASSVAPAPASPAPRTGEVIAKESCLACHAEDMLRQQRLTEPQWEKVVKKMAGWGAPIDAAEVPVLVNHLAAAHGPDAGAFAPPTQSAAEAHSDLAPLADGAFAAGDTTRGRALFATRCAACHGADARGTIGVSLVDRPLLYRAADVARTLRAGRGKMPPQADLADREVADVLAYLRTLKGA